MTSPRRPYPWALVLAGLLAAPALADDLYVFVDDEGTVHVGDRGGDPRMTRWTPGLFERWALGQVGTPHVGHRRDLPSTSPYDALIDAAARRFGVRPALARAVVATESAFDARAVSRAGAQGLMQLMPTTARDLGVDDPFDPVENVNGGTRYLAGLIRMFDDEALALAAYNAGPSRVKKLGRIPDFPETKAYVRHVLALAHRLENPGP